MIRFFFILSALVAAVLAFIMQWPWLYAGAAVLLLVAVGMVASEVLKARQQAQKPYQSAPPPRDDELSTLGIMEIREKQRSPKPASVAARDPADEEEHTHEAQEAPASSQSRGPRPVEATAGTASKEKTFPERRNGRSEPAASQPAEEGEDALAAYLHAVKVSMGAHTVCLLVQEEVALTYRIEAVVGAAEYRGSGTSFSTDTPLLTATMSRQSVTVQPVGEKGVAPGMLGYYREDAPQRLQHVALAPVARPGQPVTAFLLLDATTPDFGSRRQQLLLARFAELMTLVLEAHPPEHKEEPEHKEGERKEEEAAAPAPPPEPPAPETLAEEEKQKEIPKPQEPVEPAPSAEGEEPEESARPRREIIAEEIEKARTEGRSLALALVHLNRAEALAKEGTAAVTAAEEVLQGRLRRSAPQGRVVPFGELTYGIFYSAPVTEVEAWALELESEMGRAEGMLGGGVSIGLAMLRERHRSPDDLRADATRALEEAYATGTCTILA